MSKQKIAGFSLVEVTLAIGVVSFAFVGLFALLPQGMTTFRAALDNTTEGQIFQRIVGSAQQTDFDELTAQGSYYRYFDDQGTDLGPTVTPGSIYTVMVTPQATKLPGAAAGSTNLLTLSVQIAHDAGHSKDPFGAASPLKSSTRTTYIARNSTKS